MSIAYNPVTDGDADPGEIVWTWVPYEENDGRGKDRPVLVVAAEPGGTLLGVQLTSKPHDDTYDVGIGSGPWDSVGRPSWVRLERVFRLHQGGIRREAVALDAERFALVAAALTRRYAWRTGRPAAAAGAAGAGARRPPAPARGASPASRTPASASRTPASASRTPASASRAPASASRADASAPRTTFGSLLRRLFSR